MKNILVINDQSAEAANAMWFAMAMARHMDAGVMVWNNFEKPGVKRKQYASPYNHQYHYQSSHSQSAHLQVDTYPYGQPMPVVEQYFTSNFSAAHIAEMVIKKNVWMIVKGTKEAVERVSVFEDDYTQSILNSANCPLLLIPASASKNKFEKIVYTADLRYCRLEVLRHLVQMAAPHKADILVAHIAAKGLPDVNEKYAQEVFSNDIYSNIKYPNLYFNHIKEKDIPKAIDVMVDVMGTDLLVLVNHKFHFEEIIGHNLSGHLPDYLHIPLLVFPC